jgi:hypothetical protein
VLGHNAAIAESRFITRIRLSCKWTKVHILYDSRHIHFGIHRYEEDANRIAAIPIAPRISRKISML